MVCKSTTRCVGRIRIRTVSRYRLGPRTRSRKVVLVNRAVSIPAGSTRLVRFLVTKAEQRLIKRRKRTAVQGLGVLHSDGATISRARRLSRSRLQVLASSRR